MNKAEVNKETERRSNHTPIPAHTGLDGLMCQPGGAATQCLTVCVSFSVCLCV